MDSTSSILSNIEKLKTHRDMIDRLIAINENKLLLIKEEEEVSESLYTSSLYDKKTTITPTHILVHNEDNNLKKEDEQTVLLKEVHDDNDVDELSDFTQGDSRDNLSIEAIEILKKYSSKECTDVIIIEDATMDELVIILDNFVIEADYIKTDDSDRNFNEITRSTSFQEECEFEPFFINNSEKNLIWICDLQSENVIKKNIYLENIQCVTIDLSKNNIDCSLLFS